MTFTIYVVILRSKTAAHASTHDDPLFRDNKNPAVAEFLF